MGSDGTTSRNNGDTHRNIVVSTNSTSEQYAPEPYPVSTMEDAVDSSCAYCNGWWKPKFAQRFNTPRWLLVFMCLAAIVQGMVVNGFVSLSISNIEKRFGLSSLQTGFVASMYDIAVSAMLVPLCYYGSQQNKAKWVGYGVIVMGIGSFIYSMPHVLAPIYTYKAQNASILCNIEDNTGAGEDCSSKPSLSNYFYMFLLGQMLHGIGGSPLYSLGITYIHDNVSQKMSGFYLGVYYACSVIGPAIGYVAGGLHLSDYGEVGRVDLATVDIAEDDPRWYGAWWIGPLYSGMLAIIIAIPILGYPSLIPGAVERKAKDRVETHDKYSETVAQPDFGKKWKDLPKTCKVLFTNPTYLCITIADASDGFLLGAFVTFSPKYIEYQYSVSAGFSGILSGSLVVPSAAIGTITGGWIIKKLNLAIPGILKVAIIAVVLSLLAGLGFLAKCPNQPYAGITTAYTGEDIELADGSWSMRNLSAQCNAGCRCEESSHYTPVCYREAGIMYLSPCHAGCTSSLAASTTTKRYGSCSCLANNTDGSASTSAGLSTLVPTQSGEVQEGKCPTSCGMMPLFLVCLAFMASCTMLASIPTQEAVLRCVPNSIQSIGVGFQWLLVRLFGTIPGPIIIGYVIDSTCVYAREACSQAQNCLIYDNPSMSLRFMVVYICLKCVSIVGLGLAYYLYRPPPQPADSVDNLQPPDDHQQRPGVDNCAFTMSGMTTDTVFNATAKP